MKVLLASDGSANSQDAAVFFAHLTHVDPVELTIYTTISTPHLNPADVAGDWPEEYASEQKKLAKESQEKIASRFEGANISLKSVIDSGHAGETIVRYAEQTDTDLIVIGAQGHTTAERLLLGSTSDYVATHANCSVLVVRPETMDKPSGLTVTIAYDGSPPSRAAVEQFAKFHWGETTTVHVTSVVPIIRTFRGDLLPSVVYARAEQRTAARAHAEQAIETLRTASPNSQLHVIEAEHVGEEVVRFANKSDSDLIVVGNTGQSFIGRMLLGSVSHYTLRHAPCSVWIARQKIGD